MSKLKPLISFFVLIELFFPLLTFAVANTYLACPRSNPYYIKNSTGMNECHQKNDGSDTGVNRISVCYEGLVPCGLGKPIWEKGYIDHGNCKTAQAKDLKLEGIACQFCHFFVMINGIVSFVLTHIIPYVAVLMLVIAGLFFYLGGAKPDLLVTGKKYFYGVLIGLVLIYSSYILVELFLNVLGVTNLNLSNWSQGGPFIINCAIE